MNPAARISSPNREPARPPHRHTGMPFFLHSTRLALAALAVAALAAACGDDETTTADDSGDDTPSATIVDREFWSTEVIVDGEPFELVDGTRIRIRFGAGEIGASAGCNQLGGGWSLDGDRIVVGDMFMTEMGCEPALHAQDDLVVRFLGAGPTHALDGDTHTHTTENGDRIVLLDKEVAEPDRAIENAWEVTGFFDDLAAWSTGIAEPAVLDFRDGTLSGTSGCGPIPISPTIEITDGTLEVTGDIAEIAWCGDVDELTRSYVADLTNVLLSGEPLTIDVNGRNLRLATPDGTGITAIVVE